MTGGIGSGIVMVMVHVFLWTVELRIGLRSKKWRAPLGGNNSSPRKSEFPFDEVHCGIVTPINFRERKIIQIPPNFPKSCQRRSWDDVGPKTIEKSTTNASLLHCNLLQRSSYITV